MNDDPAEQARLVHLIQDAFARGQAALAAGNRTEARRWLDRAHRLAPGDGTITLVLASAAIGDDNPKAAELFAQVLKEADVRDAWLGLATARFLMGDLAAARAAAAEALCRFALWPDLAGLADQVARLTGAPGWCGVTGAGEVVVHPVGSGRIDVRIDGRPLGPGSRDVVPTARTNDAWSLNRPGPARPGHRHQHDGESDGPVELGQDEWLAGESMDRPVGIATFALPPAWPRGRSVTVTTVGDGGGERHLIGSPLSLRAIGRVDGHVEACKSGVRGWAWCPGDPDADPRLTIGTGRARKQIVADGLSASVPGLAPLARPRSFAVGWGGLPPGDTPIRVRGRDGRDLPGSPVSRYRAEADRVTHSRHGKRSKSRPVTDASPFPTGIAPTGIAPTGIAPTGIAPTDTSGPLAPKRRRMDQAQWRAIGTETVVLVTHDDGGGVERRVRASIAAHEAQGRRAIVLRPAKPRHGTAEVVVSCAALPDLRFELPREQPALLRLLRDTKPVAAELHHFLNHDPSVFEIIRALGVPYETHTHDYAWFCPRIALVGRGDRYCGEPAPSVCEACVAELGGYLHEDIRISALLDRSRAILSGARRVIAPSDDAAARMTRHFPGISTSVVSHEDDAALAEPPVVPRETGMVRVCVAGAIGLHKGFHVLLGCAEDAERRALDLTFVVAGTTIDDQRLIDTGRVFVTGPYQPEEAVALIQAQYATLALLPSIWPETWCLGLTELWRAGLRVAAFDVGAPAERIRRTGRGFLLPLGLSPPEINDALLNAARGRSLLPIRRSSAYKPSGCNHE